MSHFKDDMIMSIYGGKYMRINEIASLLNSEILVDSDDVELEILVACGSDLMSDVMAFAGTTNQMMLTGLVNPQTIRTAEMLDVKVVVFVRGKVPDTNMCDLAKEKGITLLSTPYSLFTSCGVLFRAGIRGKEEEV